MTYLVVLLFLWSDSLLLMNHYSNLVEEQLLGKHVTNGLLHNLIVYIDDTNLCVDFPLDLYLSFFVPDLHNLIGLFYSLINKEKLCNN